MAKSAGRELAMRLRVTFYDHAIAELEREAAASLAAHPNDTVARAYLARALFKEGRFAEARHALEALDDEDVEGLTARGDFHDYAGEVALAREDYERALARESENVDALMGLAAVELLAERIGPADRLARQAAPLLPEDDACQQARLQILQGGVAGLKAERGGFFEKLRWGPGVLFAFQQARRLCPRSPYPAFALGRFYRRAPGALGGGWPNALAALREAVNLDPYYHRPRVDLIEGLLAQGHAEEARRALADYRERFADLPAALEAVAALHV